MEEIMSPVATKPILGAAVLTAAIGALAARALRPESQVFGKTLVSGDDPDEWALTYDDGPNDRSTPELLELLARFDRRASFFMIGDFARQRPDLVREVHRAGHLVGNHTMTHPFLPTKSVSVIEEELIRCNRVLEDITGEAVRFFRAPYGGRRPAVLRVAKELGLTAVQWNVQGNDWEPIGVAGIIRRMERDFERVRRRGKGANILLHDGFDQEMGYDRTHTVRATEALLSRAKAEGKTVLTVDAWNR